MVEPIRSKRQFVQLYQRGRFGNRAPSWDTLEEFLDSGYQGLIHIRNRVADGPTWYDVPANEVAARYSEIVDNGVNPTSLYLSGMAPTRHTTIQGEVCLLASGMRLTYSDVAKPMRTALAEKTSHARGIAARCLLHHYMDPSSYDWTQELLTVYPDHVVEFSCYSVNWGTVPHRNTVIWEVRRY